MNRSTYTILTTTALALTLTGCGGKPDSIASPTTSQLPVAEVSTATVTAHELAQIRHLPGTVRAVSRATVSAKTMGTVASAHLDLGQHVSFGEILVTLSADELTATVASAQAALDLATREHLRESTLLQRGAATAETVRSLDDQRRIAAARLDTTLAQLAYTTVSAPFAGVITARFVEPGDLASPGTPLFVLEGNTLEVQVAVPESLASTSTSIGGEIIIELEDTLAVVGTITEASPAADPISRSRRVHILLPANAPASAGQFVRARWPDQSAAVIKVPSSAITAFGQMQRVFVVTGDQASLRLVRIGHVQDGTTVILSGLNAGETIVLNPPASLRDGQPLKITTSL